MYASTAQRILMRFLMRKERRNLNEEALYLNNMYNILRISDKYESVTALKQ
jgi:hypothetical protein